MALKFQDYYETLGVARDASADDIKQGFRKLARRHHPDVAKDKVAGEAKFKEINEAYEVLGDPEKRRRYDELGADWESGPRPRPPSGRSAGTGTSGESGGEPEFEFGGTGFSDFFESYFGGRHAYSGFSATGASREGEDVEADLLVTLEEALHGATRKVTLRRPGTRSRPERSDTYQVRIPPGVREGQRIRLAGQGEAGGAGATTGDLYLRVRLARHPEFQVQGSDLHTELDLAPWEAVLGVKAQIPTLDGPTQLRVPAGTLAGTQLRLRGLGLPTQGQSRGDLYATIRICTPATVTPEERLLWEQLARLSPFHPRTES